MKDDTISRQAAIRWVKTECNPYGNPTLDFESGKKVIEHLEQMPSAQPQWIPCSERLPERNGRYLVTRGLNACGSLWNRVYITNYSDLMGLKSERIWWDGNVGKSDFVKLDDVIAWMPLPKPYRKDGDPNE